MKFYELVKDTIERFLENDIPEPEQDTMVLLEYVYQVQRSNYFFKKMEPVPEDEKLYQKFLDCVRQRCTHKPVQYITGSWCFMGLDFFVNEHVLIPRFDTEVLVEEALKRGTMEMQRSLDGVKHQFTDMYKILDMCTGSGCIAISLAHFWKEWTGAMAECQVTAVDISAQALAVARKNASAHHLDIRLMQSDLFHNLEETERFDMIVSNPPYIKSEEILNLMPEVQNFEPMMALDGAEDGLKFYKIITRMASQYLNVGGWLLYEIGYDQGEAVSKLMQESGFKNIEIIKDLAGLDRVVAGKL